MPSVFQLLGLCEVTPSQSTISLRECIWLQGMTCFQIEGLIDNATRMESKERRHSTSEISLRDLKISIVPMIIDCQS